MKCPKCGSAHVQKKGIRSGKQRYRCVDCTCTFTEGVAYHKAKKYPVVNGVECPKCKSSHIIRDGKLEDGSQRFQCQSCGLNFSSKTVIMEEIKWTCPYCNGELSYSGYSRKGFREYKCKNCGTSCTGDETGKPIKTQDKADFVPIEDINPQNRKAIVSAVMRGGSVKNLSKDYKCTINTIHTLSKPYYKTELITKEQKSLIIKYGYYLKVPIDYMAEYVKCSEHKCTEILRKYKKSLMSTNHGATSQNPSKTL